MTVCKSIAIIPEPPVETLKCDERFQPVFRKKQIKQQTDSRKYHFSSISLLLLSHLMGGKTCIMYRKSLLVIAIWQHNCYLCKGLTIGGLS